MTKIMIYIFILWLTIIASISISYTQDQPSAIDILSTDCQLPCWNNLTPFETTFEEANAIIQDFESYQTATYTHEWERDSLRHGYEIMSGFSWGNEFGEYIFLTFEDDTLYNMTIDPREKITLADVIERFGIPDGAPVYYSFARERDFDYVPYQLHLYYPEYGLVVDFDLKLSSTNSAIIWKHLRVNRFELYDARPNIQEFAIVLSRVPPKSDEVQSMVNRIQQEWQGFYAIWLSGNSLIEEELYSFVIPLDPQYRD